MGTQHSHTYSQSPSNDMSLGDMTFSKAISRISELEKQNRCLLTNLEGANSLIIEYEEEMMAAEKEAPQRNTTLSMRSIFVLMDKITQMNLRYIFHNLFHNL